MATSQSSSRLIPLETPGSALQSMPGFLLFTTKIPQMQLAELREYAGRRGWEVTAEYVDIGVSGSRESRPEINRMIAAALSRAFEAVVCWKLDRLGRSLKHLISVKPGDRVFLSGRGRS